MFSDDVHPANVLVVDNEHATVETVAAALRNEGFQIDLLASGSAGVRTAQDGSLSVSDLSIVLFHGDPPELTLRDRGDGPSFVTTDATRVAESGLAINEGARSDEAISSRRFSLLEVVASPGGPDQKESTFMDNGNLHFADVVMNPQSHEVWRGHHTIRLSAKEFDLLHYFLDNPGRVITKAEIIDHVWRVNRANRVIENYISFLRRKLDAFGPPLIHTQRHVGYILRHES